MISKNMHEHGQGSLEIMQESEDGENHIDPMKIVTNWRDMFPKMGLLGKYIGDRYPRCADKPKHHFLKKGARYVLLGSSSTPEKQEDPLIWANDPEAMMLRLEKKQSSKQVRLLQKKIN